MNVNAIIQHLDHEFFPKKCVPGSLPPQTAVRICHGLVEQGPGSGDPDEASRFLDEVAMIPDERRRQ